MTEQLALNALALHDWIAERLDDLPLPSGARQALAISCYDLVVEHHVGIAVLVRAQVYGSAFSLVRSVFETFVRGVWLRHCATQAQIEKYQSDRLDLSFGQLINAVEQVEGFGDGVLSGLKTNSWKAMNSYTHGGALQVGRRVQGDNVFRITTEKRLEKLFASRVHLHLWRFNRSPLNLAVRISPIKP